MHDIARPTLIVVAHGTASQDGVATTVALAHAIRADRPEVPVELCFLDVAEPRLGATLAGLAGAAVVVPLLLSTGYHVQSDIPAAVRPHPDVRIARHLGPHPLVVDVLVDRLTAAGPGVRGDSVALVGAGSSRSDAATELAQTAHMLGRRLGRPVRVVTMSDDLPVELAGASAVATYLLAEGRFTSMVRAAAGESAAVAGPLGVHPALVDLVWLRYDEASTVCGRVPPVARPEPSRRPFE